jgi:predicted phosphodiesterase
MSALIIGDLHLSDKPRDAYRFGIFPWIRKMQNKYKPDATYLLGDLTESKDKHSATLVNKIVECLWSVHPTIVRGNHDYKANQKDPFFNFLNFIEGIDFITDAQSIGNVGIIPHYRSQAEFDQAVKDCGKVDMYLCHQTFEGAIAETGRHLTGLSASPIELMKPRLGVYAGDVHRPQQAGIVTYVGCPYHVRFGDDYEPRCLLVDNQGRQKELKFDAPRKWSLTVNCADSILNADYLYSGDQVKLTIELNKEEVADWKQIKQEVLTACKQLELDVYGVKMEVKNSKDKAKPKVRVNASNEDIFREYCKAVGIGHDVKTVGLEILKDKESK